MTWVKKLTEFKDGIKRYIDFSVDAADIATGTIDPARLPPTEGVVVASGDITTLTPTQQLTIAEGTMVVLGPGAGAESGKSYRYDGSGSKTDLANYVEIQMSVGWSAITGKPDLLPENDPVATGLFTAPAIRNTGGTPGAFIKWDAEGDEVASTLVESGSDISTTSTLNTSSGLRSGKAASDTVGSGAWLQLMDSLTSRTKAWLIQLGASNTLDFWNFASGSFGASPKAKLFPDGSVSLASMAGTGYRAAYADASGKIVVDPRHGVQSAGAVAVAINAATKRILRVTGAANLQLGNPVDCAGVTVKVVAAFNGSVAIAGEHQYSEAIPDYWYYSSTGRSVTVSNYGTDGYLKAFDLWCDGVHWYFQA